MSAVAGVVPLLVVAAAGVLAVFAHELDGMAHPTLRVPPRMAAIPATAAVSITRAALASTPGATPVSLRVPLEVDRPAVVRLVSSEGAHTVYVDPTTDAVIARIDAEHHTLGSWLIDLHWSLLAGDTGAICTFACGLLLVGSGITGLLIVRQPLTAFRRSAAERAGDTPRGRRQRMGMRHRAIGVVASLGLIAWGATGAWMNRYAVGLAGAEVPSARIDMHTTRDLESLSVLVAERIPSFILGYVVFPTGAGADDAWRIGGAVDGAALYGTSAAAVVAPVDARAAVEIHDVRHKGRFARANALVFELHAGRFGGLASQVPYALFGSAPLFLIGTGAATWWWRRRLSVARRSPSHSH